MKIEGYIRDRELLQSVRLTSLLSIIITALLLILVFTILIPFRIDRSIKHEHYITSPNTYALVITMHCSKKREAMYLDILGYIRNTIGWPPEDLFIVDSANKGVPSSLVNQENQVLFDQDLLNLGETEPYPTIFEQISLSNLTENLWPKLKHYDYIIKMTGKYKLRGFMDMLRKQQIKEDFILSFYSDKARFREGQIYTEVVGFKSDLFREWVLWIQNSMPQSTLETKTDIFTRNYGLRPYILPRMKNDADYERNDGSTVLYL